MIGTDKQMYKKFNADADGRSPHSLEALSPPQNGFGGYSFSPRQRTRTMSSSHSSDEDISRDEGTVLCDVIPRKTLFYLLSTLNAAFVDYDFSDTKASEFSKEPSLQVIRCFIFCSLSQFLFNWFSLSYIPTIKCSTWSPTFGDQILLRVFYKG